MRFTKSGPIAHSIFYTACLNLALFATSVSAFDASTETQTINVSEIEADSVQSEEMGQSSPCSFAGNENCQSHEAMKTTRLTLKNVNNLQNRDIYGSELMTKSELAKFRRDIKQCETPEQLKGFLASHRLRMKARAKERGVVLR